MEDQSGAGPNEPPAPPLPGWQRLLVACAVLLAIGALVTGGTLYYLSARHYESTDDAYIDGHIVQVATQISGRVQSLLVADNQPVQAGQTLLLIDPRDAQMKLLRARAQRANAAAAVAQMRAQLVLQQAAIDQAAADATVAEAELTQARQDLARFRTIDPAAITRQQLDNAEAVARAAEARLQARQQAVLGARAQLAADGAQLDAATAMQQAADSDLADGELQLSYTKLLAPAAGRVTKRAVEAGNYVTPGQPLLSVVTDDVWVTANFKETQTGVMRVGQPVRIEVDQYPGLTFSGHVDSFQTGTGAVFSSLPAENATGNYVKVVQRVPVKIVFDTARVDLPADLRLSPGLSVRSRVTVR